MDAAAQLTFLSFRIDLADERLWRGVYPVAMTPKAFAVLRYLVEHRGRLVTKRELLDAVWSGVHVGDAVVKSCIREIRRAIEDSIAAPRFIQTVHRRGYRFIAEPAVAEARASPAVHSAGAKPASGATRPRDLPLVGRDREMDALHAALRQAVAGERQIVFITGEPGIGKTTLVESFLDRAVTSPALRIAWGQCVDVRIPEFYLPVLEAIGRLCRAPGGTHLITLLRRYAPTWLAQMPSLIDPVDRVSLNQEILGATPERMLREMCEAMEALAADSPLILVLDDLHWSDHGTVDLLVSLARRRDPARLLVLGTLREGAGAATPHPLRAGMQELHLHRLCREIRLDVLDEAAVGAYLSGRFPNHRLPDTLARLIHERTGGNPLFMNDVVDDLVRRSSIVQGEQGWRLESAIEDIGPSVPESLRHMIDRQLDRLTPDEQRLLEAASVAGAEFSALEVATALDAPVDRVEAWSESLVGRHQFLGTGGWRQTPGGVVTQRYRFVHSLYRRAIEGRLGPSQRARLHQRIGEYKESVQGPHPDAIAPELAEHFEHAHDLERAIRYLTLAADSAVRRSANRAAVGYLARAIALTRQEPDERLETQMALLERMGTVRRVMGDMRGTAIEFGTLAAVAGRCRRRHQQVAALIQQAPALGWIDRAQSRRVAEQAITLSEDLGDADLRARARGELAFGRLLAEGWRDEDAEACAAALDVVGRSEDRSALILHVGRSAYLHCHRSDYEAAATTAAEGLQLALELRDAYHYMSCQFHRGWALLHRGDLGQALTVLVDGLQMAERNGNRAWAPVFRFAMAWVHEEAFDFEGARALCEYELDRVREPLLGHFLGLIVVGTAWLGLGKPETAMKAFAEVMTRLESGHILMDWILRLPLQSGLSEYWLLRGDLPRARYDAEQLTELAARPPERTYLALGLQFLAEISMLEGSPARAETELARSLAALEGADAPLAEWRVHRLAATFPAARKHARRAYHHRTRAARILTRLADSLHDWPELQRSLLAAPRVQACLS